jgi:hypothetical protein
MCDKNVPGPGKYNYHKTIGSEAPKYSLYSRRGDDIYGTSEKSKMPGPGKYDITTGPEQRYVTSRMKNIVNIKWGSSKMIRFAPLKMGYPGPGSYDENKASEINGKGNVFWSKFRSSTSRSLTGKPKDTGVKFTSKTICNLAPGPGAYRMFSEFGQYESKTARKFEARYDAIHNTKKESKKPEKTETDFKAKSFYNTSFKVVI